MVSGGDAAIANAPEIRLEEDMRAQQRTGLYKPETVAEALAALSDLGGGTIMAGATWIMRAPFRREPMKPAYVSLAQVPELHRLEVTQTHVRIGSAVTHARLVRELQALPELSGLVTAAGDSANPAVRQAATVGGNLCTADFAAADLVPALLCHDAEVEILTTEGRQLLSLDAFLGLRQRLESAYLLVSVLVPRRPLASAHARLPLRKAGDYPVAIVSVAVERRPDGDMRGAAIAVGSVEAVARRWRGLERAVEGLPLDAMRIHQLALDLADEFVGRDGPEVPGWYRVKVLPTLVRRAFAKLQQH
ncbi:FAD binding domain-containing protein [Bradyrhizobium sp. HKCCYLRH3099]|uniref:FAD binding domain-containing protein n=1 Tax=unclassified Bradyrhizobium TaxID=2631580 RepID=UPI003EBFC5A4